MRRSLQQACFYLLLPPQQLTRKACPPTDHRPQQLLQTSTLFWTCFVQVIVFVFVFCPKWLTDRSKYGKCVTLSNAAASAAGKSYRWALKAFCSGDLWQQAGDAFIRRQKGSTNDSIAILQTKSHQSSLNNNGQWQSCVCISVFYLYFYFFWQRGLQVDEEKEQSRPGAPSYLPPTFQREQYHHCHQLRFNGRGYAVICTCVCI